MKKRTLFLLFLIIVMVVSIFYIENNQTRSHEQSEMKSDQLTENKTEKTPPQDIPIQSEETKSVAVVNEQNLSEQAVALINDDMTGEEINAVAIGDSLTKGIGDETEQAGFIGILDRSLNKEQDLIYFENLGFPGNRSDQLLEKMKQEDIQTKITDADLIILTVGANDIMKIVGEEINHLKLDDFSHARDNFERNLRRMIYETRLVNNHAQLYLVGIYNPFELYFEDIAELNLIVESWNDTYSEIASGDKTITYIPIHDLFQNPSINVFAEDHFHPNYYGYYLISERVLNYLIIEDE